MTTSYIFSWHMCSIVDEAVVQLSFADQNLSVRRIPRASYYETRQRVMVSVPSKVAISNARTIESVFGTRINWDITYTHALRTMDGSIANNLRRIHE
jgi:hypothetical protein